MKLLPSATTFSEGLRLVFSVCALLAGVAIGIGLIGLASILVWGGWPEARYQQIIEILGWMAIGGMAMMSVLLIGMLLGGPAGRFKAGAGKTGVSIEAEGHVDISQSGSRTEIAVKPKEPTDGAA